MFRITTLHRVFLRRSESPLSTAASLEASATHSIANFESLRLHKQLGFVDLIFACVLMVVVPDFFGTAVRSGNASTFLWLLGIVFFFIPQSIVVSRLNKQLPLEGGLYEWARIAFGDLIGFLAAWNLWVYVILYSASVGLVATNYLSGDASRIRLRQMADQCRKLPDGPDIGCVTLPAVCLARAWARKGFSSLRVALAAAESG